MRNKQKNRTVWHYTYSHNIGKILESRSLLPPYLTPGYAAQQARAVAEFGEAALKDNGWNADAKLLLFSQRKDWEPASYRGVYGKTGEVIGLFNLDDYADYGIEVFRIAVSTGLLKPWVSLKEMVMMPSAMAAGLEKIAREIGSNPYDWWGTIKPVGIDKWRAIQIYNPESKEWESFEIEVEKCEIPVEVSPTKTDLKV